VLCGIERLLGNPTSGFCGPVNLGHVIRRDVRGADVEHQLAHFGDEA